MAANFSSERVGGYRISDLDTRYGQTPPVQNPRSNTLTTIDSGGRFARRPFPPAARAGLAERPPLRRRDPARPGEPPRRRRGRGRAAGGLHRHRRPARRAAAEEARQVDCRQLDQHGGARGGRRADGAARRCRGRRADRFLEARPRVARSEPGGAGGRARGGRGGRPPAAAAAARPAAGSVADLGNQAAGYGAIRGGVRFVAAYPITPATELLECMAPALARVGGVLVQAEDELASINMIVGASFGGVPALTATAGPGLSLMTEAHRTRGQRPRCRSSSST